MCDLSDYQHLKLTQIHRAMLQSELGLWHEAYLPVSGTVLDVGAGCGESAQFFLLHGAKHIIAVEGDPEAQKLLHDNFDGDSRVSIIESLVHGIKIDIDGGERNMTVEVHFPHRLASWKLAPNVTLYKISENWGSVFRKAIRKILHN